MKWQHEGNCLESSELFFFLNFLYWHIKPYPSSYQIFNIQVVITPPVNSVISLITDDTKTESVDKGQVSEVIRWLP